jgi:Protein of unknown function (DUF1097)
MDIITALAVSIGALGAVATWLFLTVGTFQIWIGFIGWASFYHCGGGVDGLRKSVGANLWGVVMAFIALLLITQVNLGRHWWWVSQRQYWCWGQRSQPLQ